jgi:hypothetical protein
MELIKTRRQAPASGKREEITEHRLTETVAVDTEVPVAAASFFAKRLIDKHRHAFEELAQ